MLSSKFYLYKTEWLDLVFDNRNKEYGAYDLRKHYADNMVKAMGITFFSVIVLFIAHAVLFQPKPVDIVRVIPDIPIGPPRVIKPDIVKPPKAEAAKPHVQVSTIKYVNPVPGPDITAVNPPKIEDLNTSAIGPETVAGKNDGVNVDLPVTQPGNGNNEKLVEDNTPKDINAIEVMPEPYGGSAAWLKFLQKNLRYPGQAVDAGKEGKVWLSFIIERDGHLSNIVVDRGPGFGLNEEALRVLKLAPAWKPGIQNGQAVRVKYNIPINFQISE